MADIKSHKIKMLIYSAAITGAVIVVMILMVSMALPVYVESRLIPDVVEKFGLTADRVQIRRIGLGGIDAGPVLLTVEGRPALQFDAVYIDYSPLSVLHGDIKGITVSGLHTSIDIQDNRITLAGRVLAATDQQAASPAKEQGNQLPALDRLIPIELKYINIHNAVIDLKWRNIPIQVPLEASLATGDLPRGRIKADLRLYPRGNPIEMEAEVNQPNNRITLSLVRSQVLLNSLADLAALFTPVSIDGTVAPQGHLSARMTPFAITEAALTADLARVRVGTDSIVLTHATTPDKGSRPVRFQAALRTADELTWSCGPFDIQGPATLRMERLQGKLSKQNTLWHLESSGLIQLPAQSLTPAPYAQFLVQKGMAHTLNIDARQTEPDALEFTLVAKPRDPDANLMAGLPDLMLKSRLPDLSIEGRYSQNHLKSKLKMTLTGLALPLVDGRLHSPAMDFTADTDIDLSDTQPRMNIQATVGTTDLSIATGAARVSIPRISLKTDISADSSKNVENAIAIDARLKVDDASMAEKSRELKISGVDIDLPLQWPPPLKGKKGSIGIRSAAFQGRALGDLKGGLQQQEGALLMDARHQSKLIKNLIVSIRTKVDAAGAGVDVNIAPFDIGPDMDLGQFVPEAAGFKMNGRVQAQGRVEVAPGRMNGSASARLTNARLLHDGLDLDLNGIQADMRIEDLINLRSGPGQKLRIESLRLGEISAEKLQVDFQVEPNETLFIERAKMKWCRGLMNTNAVRIRPGEDDYDLTLICDRLNLAMVLQQLGAARGSGEGAVNGVIPVRWSKGQLHFDKGFLYSTPGQTGTISLGGTEFLLKGLPKGSPQHTQLDIATEALKDYTYNWAKLSLESDQDILLIKLQLDGKPNRLLPFGYDKNLGTLMRVQGEGQAEFKGINIDLNFKSPINEILNYQELIKNR